MRAAGISGLSTRRTTERSSRRRRARAGRAADPSRPGNPPRGPSRTPSSPPSPRRAAGALPPDEEEDEEEDGADDERDDERDGERDVGRVAFAFDGATASRWRRPRADGDSGGAQRPALATALRATLQVAAAGFPDVASEARRACVGLAFLGARGSGADPRAYAPGTRARGGALERDRRALSASRAAEARRRWCGEVGSDAARLRVRTHARGVDRGVQGALRRGRVTQAARSCGSD